MSEHCECGAEFIYRRYVKTGNPAPIETTPAANGNIHLLPGERYEILGPAARSTHDGPLYLNHYANCPVRGRGAKK